jgi:hypothetical protein
MEATRSDFDLIFAFFMSMQENASGNNERDNLKTRNNDSLHVQEVVL